MTKSGPHNLRAKAFRPEPDDGYEAVMAVLRDRGKEMDACLRACVRWIHDNPDGALATLAPHWPETRPRGRPPKDA